MSNSPNISKRLVRLLEMMQLIEVMPATRRDLAEYFGISERMVTLDINLMRQAGLNISHQRPLGYQLHRPDPEGDTFDPNHMLDELAPDDLPDVLTIPQVARMLGIKETTIRYAANTGHIDAFKVGRQWLIRKADAEWYGQQRDR